MVLELTRVVLKLTRGKYEVLAFKIKIELLKRKEDIHIKNKIGAEEIRKFNAVLSEYKASKSLFDSKIIANEEWFAKRHNNYKKTGNMSDKKHNSAWLFNSIANKHADAMDNYPYPNVLPRGKEDKTDADILQKILPVVLEQNDFEKVYSDSWWYKLKTGNALYGVFWEQEKENGKGDIQIKQCDLLNLFWQGGIKNLEDSPYLFYVSLYDTDSIKNIYPSLKNDKSNNIDLPMYHRQIEESNKSKTAVIDVYYKIHSNNKTTLHYCKYSGDTVLYSSENDESCANGWYNHGSYPFVLDTLFVDESSPVGFGYIDVMKDCQEDIDKLNDAILRNSLMCSRQRYFYRQDGSVNKEEFADWSKDFVHVQGNLDNESIRQIAVNPLPSEVFTALSMKINELKETSGNRDFSQGGTGGGVTAASAIAALQESGSKLSRDMIKSSFRAFTKICYLSIELIRQFYTEPRCFRITNKKSEEDFVFYSNKNINKDMYGSNTNRRVPIFDIVVSANKKTPFSRVAGNELAKELYAMGFFTAEKAPQALIALQMMDFEGKESLEKKLSEIIGAVNQSELVVQKELQNNKNNMGKSLSQQPPNLITSKDIYNSTKEAYK